MEEFLCCNTKPVTDSVDVILAGVKSPIMCRKIPKKLKILQSFCCITAKANAGILFQKTNEAIEH